MRKREVSFVFFQKDAVTYRQLSHYVILGLQSLSDDSSSSYRTELSPGRTGHTISWRTEQMSSLVPLLIYFQEGLERYVA